jgi:hypothetical protein
MKSQQLKTKAPLGDVYMPESVVFSRRDESFVRHWN